jgi:hypothetical protein
VVRHVQLGVQGNLVTLRQLAIGKRRQEQAMPEGGKPPTPSFTSYRLARLGRSGIAPSAIPASPDS